MSNQRLRRSSATSIWYPEEDMYAAIDGLVDKLDRRVRKYKEKAADHHARDSRKRQF